jgi:peptidoglycan/LPS O-acetylase OafA/YrhL
MTFEASEPPPMRQLDPSQSTTARKSFYRPELDALRFFAFLLVFIYHVRPARFSGRRLAGGITVNSILYPLIHCMGDGVCLFFLLSAYLITTLMIRERSVTGTLDLTSFYRRRILRIWPLYFFALALVFIVSTAVRGFPGVAPIAAYVLLAGNLNNVFHIHADIGPLKIFHLWSISVEEQFYLMFPLIARSIKLRWFPGVFAAILVVMIATVTYASHWGESRGTLWYNSGVQFIMFGAGIMLAYLFSDRPLPRLKYGTRFLMFAAGSGVCFSSEYLFTFRGPVPTIAAYLMVMLGCSLVLAATLGFSGHVPRSLVYLGKISYGLYVYHIWGLSFAAYILSALLKSASTSPSVTVAKDVFGLALTIAMAAISYRWLEAPFLRLKRQFEVVKTRPV